MALCILLNLASTAGIFLLAHTPFSTFTCFGAQTPMVYCQTHTRTPPLRQSTHLEISPRTHDDGFGFSASATHPDDHTFPKKNSAEINGNEVLSIKAIDFLPSPFHGGPFVTGLSENAQSWTSLGHPWPYQPFSTMASGS